jgi:hypothetical protein
MTPLITGHCYHYGCLTLLDTVIRVCYPPIIRIEGRYGA